MYCIILPCSDVSVPAVAAAFESLRGGRIDPFTYQTDGIVKARERCSTAPSYRENSPGPECSRCDDALYSNVSLALIYRERPFPIAECE